MTIKTEEIDCKRLIDQVYAQLNRAYENSYGRGFRRPAYQVVLSQEQLRALQRYVVNIPASERVFIGFDNSAMFGHLIEIQKPTPYLKAIIGEVE